MRKDRHFTHQMSKAEAMDHYLDSFGRKVTGREVREAVVEIFGIDLDMISKNNYGSQLTAYDPEIMENLRQWFTDLPSIEEQDAGIMKLSKAEAMDRYIEAHHYALTGAEHRALINQLFGVNLDGLSGLERARLSVYSKGQWVIQNEQDLLVISSNDHDSALYVETTDFFKKQTGSKKLPHSLAQTLLQLGYTYDEGRERYTYISPTGESIPDIFKTKTIKEIITTIKTEHRNDAIYNSR